MIIFLDTETNIKNIGENAIGKNKASPWHPDNSIVYTGWRCENWPEGNTETLTGVFNPNTLTKDLLVAQNVAFDLEHLLMSPYKDEWREWCRTGRIWDVMLAEYLLTGQELKWASLDELSMIYGGTLKDSRMKEYWEAGIDTEDIPEDEIIPYLEQDVLNLEIIYNGQLKAAKEKGMLPLIESQMEARLATIMMEYNGMYFDKKLAHEEKEKLKVVYMDLAIDVTCWMQEQCPKSTSILLEELNPNSNKQLSAVLFGGTFNVKRDLPALDAEGNQQFYKSGAKKGQLKTKKTDMAINCPGLFKSTKEASVTGVYPVGDDALKKISHPIVDKILKLREYGKQIGTYFDGYSSLVWPDGLIHGQLNHCQTNTGRLSSSNPNLQNISNKSSGGDE